jgi:urea transport system ATP-binding protein
LAGALAHGERQWLEIGMLLVQDPQLLLLDEPVAGMTRAERDRTGALLQRVAQRRSVLVVEHDMAFLRRFGSVVTVLHLGRMLVEGPVESVQADARVVEVYLGRGHVRPAAGATAARPAQLERFAAFAGAGWLNRGATHSNAAEPPDLAGAQEAAGARRDATYSAAPNPPAQA